LILSLPLWTERSLYKIEHGTIGGFDWPLLKHGLEIVAATWRTNTATVRVLQVVSNQQASAQQQKYP
jgi:hypothetical protein